jgi:hypothetical protein
MARQRRTRVQVRIRDDLIGWVDGQVDNGKAAGEKVTRTAMVERGLELLQAKVGASRPQPDTTTTEAER